MPPPANGASSTHVNHISAPVFCHPAIAKSFVSHQCCRRRRRRRMWTTLQGRRCQVNTQVHPCWKQPPEAGRRIFRNDFYYQVDVMDAGSSADAFILKIKIPFLFWLHHLHGCIIDEKCHHRHGYHQRPVTFSTSCVSFRFMIVFLDNICTYSDAIWSRGTVWCRSATTKLVDTTLCP